MTNMPPAALIARCTNCGRPFLAGGIGEEERGPAAIIMAGGFRIGHGGQPVSISTARGRDGCRGNKAIRSVSRHRQCPGCDGGRVSVVWRDWKDR